MEGERRKKRRVKSMFRWRERGGEVNVQMEGERRKKRRVKSMLRWRETGGRRGE